MDQTSIFEADFFAEYPEAPDFIKEIDRLLNLFLDSPIEFEEFNSENSIFFKIKFRGDGYDDDLVDVNIAKYVISLQERFNEIFKENGIPPNAFLVKVKVEKGCKEVKAFFNGIIEFCKGMKSGHKALVVLMLAIAVSGVLIGPSYFDYAKHKIDADIRKKELLTNAQRDDKMLSILENLSASIEEIKESRNDLEKPIRDLIKSAPPNTDISLNNAPFVKRDKVLERIKATRNPKSDFENKYIDGKYRILDIDGENDVLTILVNGKALKISFSDFSKADKEKLVIAWGRDGEMSARELDLRVTLDCNAYRIRGAKLVGINETPREETVNPDDIDFLK